MRFPLIALLSIAAASPALAIMRTVGVDDSLYIAAGSTVPVAWIQYTGDQTQTVSGVLIADQFLLSAAHAVRTGPHTAKLGGETYTIVNWIANPSFNGSNPLGGFDFSIARLDRRVTNMAPLVVNSSITPNQAAINVFGCGTTGLGNGTGYAFPWSPIPATWPVRGMTNKLDVDASLPHVFISDFDNGTPAANTLSFLGSTAAATAREGTILWGDSGGPVTITVSGKEQVVGINSTLADQNANSTWGDYGDLSFYARVSSAYSWITTNAWQPGRVAGKVNLSNFVGSPTLRTATIQLRAPGNPAVLESFSVPLAADSGFSFVTARRGLTDIRFLVNGFCARVLTNVNITNTSPGNLAVLLPNGDPDLSQEVDAADIDLVIANFGATTTLATLGDLDGSGEVDAADIDIAIANFGETGNA